MTAHAAVSIGQPPVLVPRGLSKQQGHRVFPADCYVDAVKVRPREAADGDVAREFLARHDSLRVARLGELVHPLDHPALMAETPGGRLLGMLTYVPGQDWRQCEIWNALSCRDDCRLTGLLTP